jgi:hypothetical protein
VRAAYFVGGAIGGLLTCHGRLLIGRFRVVVHGKLSLLRYYRRQDNNEGALRMDRCPKQPSWFSYFKENMEALGLAVPTSWYGAQTVVTGAISSLVSVHARLGSRVTVG